MRVWVRSADRGRNPYDGVEEHEDDADDGSERGLQDLEIGLLLLPVAREHDRVPRQESYVKDFRPMRVGAIDLSRGRSDLVLRATQIPGSQAMEFRLLMLRRVATTRPCE